MAQEIGVAYVSLLPSGRGFSKATQSEAEKGFAGAEKTSNRFFDGVTKWAKRGAVVIGGMVTAVGALAVGGGIARALNIEDATAKLKGLGHDTKAVEAIMKDALAAVKGTAFGLDAAATVAASAVASGIKPGKELERYLRLTADAATIAGTSLDEMGSILNKVTAKGVAQMDDLNRLTERGIPILQWLADEYGVTADELAKMVSRGEVDAETFRRAIENNISGAALESGKTTRGAFANMMAALSRFGEGLAGPALGAARDFFGEIMAIADGITSRLQPAFADLQWFVDGLDFKFSEKTLKFLDPLISAINGFAAAAKTDTILDWLDELSKVSPTVALIMELADAIQPLIPAFKEIGERVGPVLADALARVGEAIAPMVPLIRDALVDAIIQLAPPLTDLLVALLPVLPPLTELVALLLPALVWLLEALIPPITDFISNIADMAAAFSEGANVIAGDSTFEDLGLSVLTAGGILGDFARAAYDMYMSVAAGLRGLGGVWSAIWGGMMSFFSSIGAGVISVARSIWTRVPAEFQRGISQAVAWVQTLPGRIMGVLAGVGSWLFGSGQALIQGFISGIRSMLGAVGSAIGSVMDFASGFFPHSPALRGPFSGAGWTAVADGGSSLMEQFAFGAENFRPQFSFGDMTAILTGASAGSSSAAQGGLRPGDRVVFEVEGMPFTAVAKRVVSSALPSSGVLASELGRH